MQCSASHVVQLKCCCCFWRNGTFADSLNVFCKSCVDRRKAECQADFVVIKGAGSTLSGRETAMTLGLLHVGLLHVNSAVCEHSKDDISRRYQDLFTGIGLLQDYELKLHVDDQRNLMHSRYVEYRLPCVREWIRRWTSC